MAPWKSSSIAPSVCWPRRWASPAKLCHGRSPNSETRNYFEYWGETSSSRNHASWTRFYEGISARFRQMRGFHAIHQVARSGNVGDAESQMKTVWRVFGYLKGYPALALGTLACAITGTLMVIVFPGVTKWIIDDVVRQHHPEKLPPLVLFAL